MPRIHPPRALQPKISYTYELAVETPPPLRTMNVALLVDDKALFDVAQSHLSSKLGRRLTQWEAATLILAAAVTNREGPLADMPRVEADGSAP